MTIHQKVAPEPEPMLETDISVNGLEFSLLDEIPAQNKSSQFQITGK
jgi:hypothetical protein